MFLCNVHGERLQQWEVSLVWAPTGQTCSDFVFVRRKRCCSNSAAALHLERTPPASRPCTSTLNQLDLLLVWWRDGHSRLQKDRWPSLLGRRCCLEAGLTVNLKSSGKHLSRHPHPTHGISGVEYQVLSNTSQTPLYRFNKSHKFKVRMCFVLAPSRMLGIMVGVMCVLQCTHVYIARYTFSTVRVCTAWLCVTHV